MKDKLKEEFNVEDYIKAIENNPSIVKYSNHFDITISKNVFEKDNDEKTNSNIRITICPNIYLLNEKSIKCIVLSPWYHNTYIATNFNDSIKFQFLYNIRLFDYVKSLNLEKYDIDVIKEFINNFVKEFNRNKEIFDNDAFKSINHIDDVIKVANDLYNINIIKEYNNLVTDMNNNIK